MKLGDGFLLWLDLWSRKLSGFWNRMSSKNDPYAVHTLRGLGAFDLSSHAAREARSVNRMPTEDVGLREQLSRMY